MKKVTSLIALIMAMLMLLVSCGGTAATTTDPVETTDTSATTEASTDATTETSATTETTVTTGPVACAHEWETLEGTAPSTFKEGTGKFKCKLCGEEYEGTVPATKTIKILAIGNSFSVDAMETYLYNILKNLGVEKIVLGNLYIGGCSLDTHWDNIQSGAKAYTFYYNYTGKWLSSTQSVEYGLTFKDWDVITIQQVSQNSGLPATYTNLQNILDWINENKTNKDAKVYWHMTWAYQGNSTHSGFAYYGNSQEKMYNAIATTASTLVENYKGLDGVIPAGTAIQNLRTSYVGDTLTRDGYHLAYISASTAPGGYLGRYTASLTWVAYILGLDISDFDWYIEKYTGMKEALPAVKEAVMNAIAKPFEVTQSSYPGTDEPDEPKENTALSDADIAFLKEQGVDPSNYEVLKLDTTLGAYYLSSSSTGLTTNASNSPYFFATQRLTKEELPVGSIICIKDGYQYRPEGWDYTGTRPDNVTTSVVTVSESWWGKYTTRAFNVSYVGASKAVGTSDIDALKIYVPKTEVDVPEEQKPTVSKEDLEDTSKYTKLELDFEVGTYYNSTDSTKYAELISSSNSTASNLPYFAATQMFKKDEIPVGSVIVVDSGYQYRPEGWTALGTKTTSRPGNVVDEIVVVDEAWWSNFNYRAFNLSYIGSSTRMTEADTVHLTVYIPVK